jgi:CBS domain-containing protein
MPTMTADMTSRVAELAGGAFKSFCDEIAGMFGLDMRCERQQVGVEKAEALRAHFRKLAAVHVVQGQGALEGTFHLLLDHAGLFILSGVVVMLPEGRIIEEIKRNSMENTEHLQDPAREVGNLLVGSWDRVFRAECKGHKHFVKAATFIGKAWESPSETGLSTDAEALFVLYEMTVEPYPSFKCAAVFPKAVLAGIAPQQEPAELPPTPAKDAPAQDVNGTVTQTLEVHLPPAAVAPTGGSVVHSPPAVVVSTGESIEAAEVSDVPAVNESIGPHVQESALSELLRTPAAEIMEEEVVWASPDDTVQDVIAKMQQFNCGYVLVGANGDIEGLVSNSKFWEPSVCTFVPCLPSGAARKMTPRSA